MSRSRKIKILFSLTSLNTNGGLEKAFLEMLKVIDKTRYEVDILLLSFDKNSNPFAHLIPNWMNIIKAESHLDKSNIIKHIFAYPIETWEALKARNKLKKHRGNNKWDSAQTESKLFKPLDKEYDIAICYDGPTRTTCYFVEDNVNAKRKVIWIHNHLDFIIGHNKTCIKYLNKYDYIVSVSKWLKSCLIEEYEFPSRKVIFYKNHLDYNEILEKSKEPLPNIDAVNKWKSATIKILSVGRLSKQKNYMLAIKACKILVDKGYDIQWLVCGEG